MGWFIKRYCWGGRKEEKESREKEKERTKEGRERERRKEGR